MFYIYKITNKIDGMMYIGAHSTDNLDDGYMGSGIWITRAIKKHGRHNFTKEILSVHTSFEEMYEEEKRIVTSEIVESPQYYNLKVGGYGGAALSEQATKKRNKKISETVNDQFKNGRKGHSRSLSAENRKKISDKLKGRFTGENNYMHGKNVADLIGPERDAIRRDNIRKGNTGKVRTDDHKANYSAYASRRFWIVNQNGECKHCVDINDPRLVSGEDQRGKKWKTN